MKLLGVPFETDNESLRGFLSDGDQHHLADMQKRFPGFMAVAIKVMRELQQRRCPVGRLEYKRGKITAYPPADINHPPTEGFIYLVGDENAN